MVVPNGEAALGPPSTNGGHHPGGSSDSIPPPIPIPGPTSPQSSLIGGSQSYLLFPTFVLESGIVLHNVPLAFKTWGKLDPVHKDNVIIVAHALTGSADVEDWWGPLLGPGKLFDPTRFFIFCANVLGSPYGSGSPCTRKGGELDPGSSSSSSAVDSSTWWGPEFPATTVRDDIRLAKAALDYLGVEQIASIIGGSMGGMAVLEWPLLYPIRNPPREPSMLDSEEASSSSPPAKPYIRSISAIATCSRHSAWCISWAEAQRQSIYSDPSFNHGYYSMEDPPRNGLSAARMAALLTYRSRDSFESRFGRRLGAKKGKEVASRGVPSNGGGGGNAAAATATGSATRPSEPRRTSIAEEALAHHNEGNRSPRILPSTGPGSGTPRGSISQTLGASAVAGHAANGTVTNGSSGDGEAQTQTPSPTTLSPPGTGSATPATVVSESKVVPPSFSPSTHVGQSSIPNSIDSAPSSTSPSTGSASQQHYSSSPARGPQIFSAQSYLRYQGDKFVKRFDANCYIHLTRKMDMHDLARGRAHWGVAGGEAQGGEAVGGSSTSSSEEVVVGESSVPRQGEEDDEALERVLGFLCSSARRFGAPPPAVHVVSIESDGLFHPPEQRLVHDLVQGSTFDVVRSPDGHDGFLLEFEQVNGFVGNFLRKALAKGEPRGTDGRDLWEADKGVGWEEWKEWGKDAVTDSLMGAVEDVTRW